ncbi:DUF397 domain-containing protein [Kitasatospora sp. NPDC057198]|uniref:DUF397 domain-containing protein n=1 Tax=Kitasatospora sp. NPDC057198 TaxID=3346046 RepID=UPI003627ED94
MREPAIRWRKSSYSLNENACCVEVADIAAGIGVRDSKDPEGSALRFGPRTWAAFVGSVRAGAYDSTTGGGHVRVEVGRPPQEG